MILYQLRCGKDHQFEAWFKDGATCDRQLSRKTVECPVRFPSIEALVHTEVRASPIRDVIDQPSFDALLEGARERLKGFCVDGREVAFPMSVHMMIARKA